MYYVPYIYVHVKSVYIWSEAPPSDQSVGLHTGPLC